MQCAEHLLNRGRGILFYAKRLRNMIEIHQTRIELGLHGVGESGGGTVGESGGMFWGVVAGHTSLQDKNDGCKVGRLNGPPRRTRIANRLRSTLHSCL
jgi:hypothetical protein